MTKRRISLALRVAAHVGAVLSVIFGAILMLQAYREIDDRYHFDINVAHWATRQITSGLALDGRVVLPEPHALDYYKRPEAPLNAFRVMDPRTGEQLLAGGNATTLSRVVSTLSYDLRRTASEIGEIELDGRDLIWGMVRHYIGGQDVVVEVAIDRQTKGLRWDAFVDELVVDLHLGWLIGLIGVVLLVYLSIRAGLAPLVEAGQTLRRSDPLSSQPILPLQAQGGGEVHAFLDDVRDTFERQGAVLRAQQEFVGRAAHELRTPLTMMALDLATIDDERARVVETDVHDLAAKIANMLAWARMDAGADAERRPVDLAAVARRVVGGLEGLAAQKGSVLVIEANADALAEGDAASIEEAVRNLVENAVRHGHADSTIVIRCGPAGLLSVEDDGPGFGSVDPQLLCRPFWKGRASSAGSGLGLALVKRVADRHDARLEFGTSPTGGGRVTLQFKANSPLIDTQSTAVTHVKHDVMSVK